MIDEREDALRAAIRVVRERWWLVLLCALLGIAAGAGLALRQAETYEASSQVIFGGVDPVSPLPSSGFDAPERETATAVITATSPEVIGRVKRATGARESVEDLQEKTTVAAEENASVLTFTVEDPLPQRAAQLANAFAEAFIAFRRESYQDNLRRAEDALRQRARQLPPESTQRQQIEQQIAQIVSAEAGTTGDAQIIGRSEIPDSPAGPRPKRDAAIGAIFGLILGLALAFLLDLLDPRAKRVDDFEEAYGAPALAAIPNKKFGGATGGPVFEPYRVLRSSIGVYERSEGLRALVVTSAVGEEGKSTVAVNLARAVAMSGRPVALVDCDLRRPAVAAQLRLTDPGGGLSTALVRGGGVGDLLRPSNPPLRNFSVLPSGPLPPNAAELLRSAQMDALLDELCEDGRLVILDAAPLLPVADTHALLSQPNVDGCIIVARAFTTTREEARRARAVLDRLGVSPLGVVVTGLKAPGSGDDYYGPNRDGGVQSGSVLRRDARTAN